MRKPMCHGRPSERGSGESPLGPARYSATSEPPGRTGPGHSRYRMNREAEGRQAFCELGWYREVVYSVPEQGGSFFILFF